MTELSSSQVWMPEMEVGLSEICAAVSVKRFTDIESKLWPCVSASRQKCECRLFQRGTPIVGGGGCCYDDSPKLLRRSCKFDSESPDSPASTVLDRIGIAEAPDKGQRS